MGSVGVNECFERTHLAAGEHRLRACSYRGRPAEPINRQGDCVHDAEEPECVDVPFNYPEDATVEVVMPEQAYRRRLANVRWMQSIRY